MVNQGAFDSNKGAFDSNQGVFDSNQGAFNSNQGVFDSNQGAFDSNQGAFNSNQGVFDSNQGAFDSNQGVFDSIPTELHLLILSCLDPVDRMCLGLTSAHFYNLQKLHYGTTALQTKRKGRPWESRAEHECRHCGINGCQLYMHLRDWMPSKYEYCAIREVYGLKAQEESKTYCHRCNPLKPTKCGRHPVKEVELES